jgi:hypothetical protein
VNKLRALLKGKQAIKLLAWGTFVILCPGSIVVLVTVTCASKALQLTKYYIGKHEHDRQSGAKDQEG